VSESASLSGWFGVHTPAVFDTTRAEYQVLCEGAAVLDMSPAGKLRVAGADRIAYLQGQLSQDILPLSQRGAGAYSCLLKPTGQMLSDMVLLAIQDAILVLTPPQTCRTVQERLEQFIIMEDVEIEDITPRYALFHVAGSQAAAALEALGPAANLPLWQGAATLWRGHELPVVRTDRCGEQGYDLLAPAEIADDLWQALHKAGGHPVGYEAWNVRRVEAGIPLFGVDMNESTLPLEAGLGDRAISLTKGCYTGQEVIHRIVSRGHTNRSLVGLRLSGDLLPAPRAAIGTEARADAGWVTSAVHSFALQRGIALGYLRNEVATPGSLVTVHRETAPIPAEVAKLPFVEPRRA